MAGFGGAVKLTGESEYRQALQKITQSLKEVSSEMKLVSSAYDKNDKSVQALTAKQNALTAKLEQQKDKLNMVKTAYAEMSRQYETNKSKHEALVKEYDKEKAKLDEIGRELGEDSREYQEQKKVVDALNKELQASTKAQDANEKSLSNMRIEMNKSQADINKTERELNKLNMELKEAKMAESQATTSTKELDTAMDNLDDSIDKNASGFTVLKGAVANLISNGIQMAINAMHNLVGEAVDSADALYKFEQTMGFAGFDDRAINKAKASMKDYADKTVYDLDTVANTTAQLAANGIKDYTGLTQAAGNLNAVAGGNADTFRSVAMMLTQTAGAGKLTTENWNQLTDAIPGASGKLQEALRDAGAFTGDFREAMAKGEITADEFNDAIMKLGSEPVAVEAAKSVETFEGAVGNLEATFVNGFMEIYDTIGRENITGIINKINDVVGSLLDGLKTAIKWIVDNGNTIIAVLGGMAVGVGVYVGYTSALIVMTQGWKALTIAQKASALAQKMVNIAMKANPIGLVISGIVALVGAFIILWKRSEKFRNFWKGLWKNIKKIAEPIIQGISDAFKTAWDSIVNVWNKAVAFFKAVWNGIKMVFSGVVLYYQTIFTGAVNAIKLVFSTLISFFTTIWNGIKVVFSGVATFFSTIFRNAVTGIKNQFNGLKSFFSGIWGGIKGVFGDVASYFSGKFSGAVSAIKKAFNGLGSFFGGIWKTIKDKFSSIGTKIGSAIGDAAKGGINKVIAGAQKVINQAIGLINGAIGMINKLPGVKVGKISKVSFPRLATGGVLERGQIGLLEGDGAEAVVPLEKNTKWIKRVADDMKASLMMSTRQNQVSSVQSMDYDETVRAFQDAMSGMKVVLDDEVAGKFVVRTVTNVIYT